MKAAIIREHGGPEVISVEDVPEPELRPGEVLVKLRAATLNHLDVWVRRGGRTGELAGPHILGSDGAGTIAKVGEGVQGVAVRDEVLINPGLPCGHCEFCRAGEQSLCEDFGILGMARDGTFAEMVAVPARCVCPKPRHLNFEEASCLGISYITAWRMLVHRAAARPGETVLIHGIGGAVALAALQFAILNGCRVIVTSSSNEKLGKSAALGAHEHLNYRTTPDLAEAVRKLTRGRGVDIVLDTVGAATWPVDFGAVRRGGRIVICGVTTGAEAVTNLQTLYWNQITVLGSTLGSDEDVRAMLSAVSADELHPVIDDVMPLARAREAAERMEAGKQFGNICLKIPG
jgi:NADPH:quinone reductase-like Zn-dependent oxidoreductase